MVRFSRLAVAALAVAVEAAPFIQARQNNATTASERLGLTWLGGNSSLPKIL